jgi:ribosomal protein S1
MAENNTEVTKVAINDIGTEEDFIKAVDSTIKNFDDGDLVEGTVVKVDHDEVLLDIGYKTEGVIPSRELSIKKMSSPKRSSRSAIRSRLSSSPKRTRKAVLSCPRSVRSTSAPGATSSPSRTPTALLKAPSLKLSRAA